MASSSISEKRVEILRRAAKKKTRNVYGLIVGLVFIVIGLFINEIIIVLGGGLIAIISLLNIAASNYAERQLRLIEAEKQNAAPGTQEQIPAKTEEKKCPHCGKATPLNSNFCEQCGKSLRET